MASKKTNFILQLCHDNRIPDFYEPVLINTCSQNEFRVPVADDGVPAATNLHLVCDLPDFLQIEQVQREGPTKLRRVSQYAGYLLDLTKFEGVEDLITKTFSRNPRKNLRAKHRKLESLHTIRYAFYYGDIPKDHYDYLFDVCYRMLEARFHEKKIFNRYLLDWKQHFDLFYPKIVNKEASLFAIYDGQNPISITLNFHKADIVFSYIQIYDVGYHTYSMGDIAMLKNIEWCYEHGFTVWDLSKGFTENKRRWCNHTYQFEHHVFYNGNSPLYRTLAYLTVKKLALKQLLRKKGLIGGRFQMDKVFYYTKKGKLKDYNWKTDSPM